MIRRVLFILLLSLAACGLASAGGYNYLKTEDFKSWLQEGKKVTIVDIQTAADFGKQHFKGAIETNAYPVKSDESRQRLDKTIPLLTASANP
ncbi:MAG TPA: rhodanese-like domain-containing protein, partial [Geobacteraceae bacterium]|nr:rhodanese-like domain-containing protein [Geobacteraceae bacterium]